MIRCVLLLLCLLAIPPAAMAAFDPAPIENVSRAYAAIQPGLETYRVDIETSKLGEMLARMTAGMPPEARRPVSPVLRKYWSRAAGTSVIRAEVPDVFPYMQELVGRFSAEFAVDLRSMFLPLAAAEQRRTLLRAAAVKSYETQLEQARTQNIEITFREPLDVEGAFYGTGLDLPRQAVKSLNMELDPNRKILKRLDITTVDHRLTVEIRHQEVQGGSLPGEIRVTTPDGSIDDGFATTFGEIEGYLLPTEQVRTVRRPGRQETLTVRFTGYRLNLPMPEDIAGAPERP